MKKQKNEMTVKAIAKAINNNFELENFLKKKQELIDLLDKNTNENSNTLKKDSEKTNKVDEEALKQIRKIKNIIK